MLATLDAAATVEPSGLRRGLRHAVLPAPAYLLHLLHPYLLWGRLARWNEAALVSDEFGVYGGGVTLLVAVWWVARQPSRYGARRSTRPACVAAFGVVGLWLATGSYGGLYYLQTWLPLVSQFRAPVRYVLFAQWALAVLATFALAHLAAASE